MRITSRNSLCVPVLGAVLGLSAAGCGGDDAAPPPEGAGFKIIFDKVFTAHDGTHTFKVPVTVPGVKGIKWSISNSAIAEIEAYEDDPSATGSDAMIIAKAPGTVTVRAHLGNVSDAIETTITGVTPSTWELGRARYQEGPKIRNDVPMANAACTNCHGANRSDVEHTPAQIGGYTDQELITIFTQGMKPAGVKNRVVPVEQWSPVHRWQMSEEEKLGIVAYLRSLEPQSHGTSDFGGRGVFRGQRR
ncbi:MAG TPA: hypothetical protein VGG33_12435 [Polyangia bacterium]